MSLLDAFEKGLVFPIGADISDMVTGLEKAQAKLDEADIKFNIANKDLEIMGEGAKKSGAGLQSLASDAKTLAVPLLAAGVASYAATEKFGGMAQELKDLSFQTGISTTDLQHLQYAAVISGTDVSTLSRSVNKLTLSMAEAKDPASDAYKAFMGLGIDPTGKTPKQVFDLTAEALMGMEDETTRNQIAMDLYGTSWKGLLPYMKTYIEKKDEIQRSPTLSPEELERLDEAKARWDKLNYTFTVYTGNVIAFMDEMQVRFQKYNPFAYLMGITGEGSISGGPSAYEGMPHFAGGGIVTQPTVAVVGEAGPEAVVPLSTGGAVGGITFKDCTFNGVAKETVKDMARELYTFTVMENRRRGQGT